MTLLLESALIYLQKYNFSVIPVRPDKKPYVKWEEFQSRKSSKDEIIQWWNKWPNAMIGIVTGEISNLFVIDIDTKQGQENIESFLPDTLITPTCRSPRGGTHIYFKDPNEKLTVGAGVIPGTDFRGNGGYITAPPSSNGTGRSYEWLQGLSISDVPLANVPAQYLLFIINNSIRFIREQKDRKEFEIPMFVKGRRDNDLFHVANSLVKSRMPEEEIRQVIEKLALSCNPPFPLREVPDKVESALKRSERASINLTEEIRAWISVTNGYFSVTNCYKSLENELGVTKRYISTNVRQIMHRFVKEGLLDRHPTTDGLFKKTIQDDIEETNWKDTDERTVDIIWPFGIENLVHIKPKNIIVVAGSSDAGKTTFMLNVIEKNMNNHKINYFNGIKY